MGVETIRCRECGQEFLWSEEDQEYYAAHDYQPPRRCLQCRRARRVERNQKVKATLGPPVGARSSKPQPRVGMSQETHLERLTASQEGLRPEEREVL